MVALARLLLPTRPASPHPPPIDSIHDITGGGKETSEKPAALR